MFAVQGEVWGRSAPGLPSWARGRRARLGPDPCCKRTKDARRERTKGSQTAGGGTAQALSDPRCGILPNASDLKQRRTVLGDGAERSSPAAVPVHEADHALAPEERAEQLLPPAASEPAHIPHTCRVGCLSARGLTAAHAMMKVAPSSRGFSRASLHEYSVSPSSARRSIRRRRALLRASAVSPSSWMVKTWKLALNEARPRNARAAPGAASVPFSLEQEQRVSAGRQRRSPSLVAPSAVSVPAHISAVASQPAQLTIPSDSACELSGCPLGPPILPRTPVSAARGSSSASSFAFTCQRQPGSSTACVSTGHRTAHTSKLREHTKNCAWWIMVTAK